MPTNLNMNFNPAGPVSVGFGPTPGCLCASDIEDPAWTTAEMNAKTQRFWRNYMTTLALEQFEWVNLPDEVPPRFIEMTLLYQGWGCFFEKAPGVLAFAGGAQTDMLDMYYNPQEVQLIAGNGTEVWDRRCDDVVKVAPDGTPYVEVANAAYCFDNVLRYPMMDYIDLYSRRLAHIDRTIDENVLAQLTPWVLTCSEEARTDTVNYFKQLVGHEPAIIQNEGFSFSAQAGVLNTQAPFIADKLHDLKIDLIADIMTCLGTDSMSGEKRERMIQGEMDSNNEQIALSRHSRLDARREAAERCNKLFGTDIHVEWKINRRNDNEVMLDDFNDYAEGGDNGIGSEEPYGE